MDIEQKAAAIRSVFVRLKNGESKSSICRDFRGTEILKRVEIQLSNSPTQKNREQYRIPNFVLLACLISVTAIRYGYFTSPEHFAQKQVLFKALIVFAGLTVLPFVIFKYLKTGYDFLIIVMMHHAYRIGSQFHFFYSTDGRLVVNTFFCLLLVTTLLAGFLRIKLFPQSGVFGIKRDAEGNPVFED